MYSSSSVVIQYVFTKGKNRACLEFPRHCLLIIWCNSPKVEVGKDLSSTQKAGHYHWQGSGSPHSLLWSDSHKCLWGCWSYPVFEIWCCCQGDTSSCLGQPQTSHIRTKADFLFCLECGHKWQVDLCLPPKGTNWISSQHTLLNFPTAYSPPPHYPLEGGEAQ